MRIRKMAENLFKNRSRVFVTWLWSYAVVLLIPLLIGTLLYVQSVRIIDEEVNRAHDASLNQAKTVMDGNLLGIQRASYELQYNSQLRNLMFQKNELTPSDLFSMYELQSTLINIKRSNNNLSGVYVCFKNSDYILSNTKRITAESYDTTIPLEFGIESDQWFDIVWGSSSKYKILESDKVIYIHPIYGVNYSRPDAVIVMLIDDNQLTKALRNVQWTTNATITIIDNENEYLSSGVVEQLPDFMHYEALAGTDNMFKEKLDDDMVAVSYVASGVNYWKYVSVIPTDEYLENVQNIKLLIFVYIAVCLFVGLVIVVFLVRRNFKPLKKLTQIMGPSSDEKGAVNEFKYVEESILNLLEEKESLHNKLARQNEAMRNNFLVRLMKGRIKSDMSFTDSCELYNITFSSDEFSVMVFQIDTLNEALWEDKLEDDNLANYIIKYVNEELFNDSHNGYMAEVDGRICSILNLQPDQEIPLQAIEMLENRFGLTVSVAVSGTHFGYTGISKAYEEAIEVIEYKMLVDDINPVMYFNNVFSQRKPGFDESVFFKKERQFTNFIVNKDYKSAGNILNDILVNDLLKTTPSLQIVKCRLFGLLNTMLNVMGEIRVSLDAKLFDDVDMVTRLMDSKTVSEVQSQVNYIFTKLNEHYKQDGSNVPIGDKYSDIVDYLKVNFIDNNLSVSGISDMFETSISSLSRMFKKNMGITPLDYIHKLRIENSKELLKNSNLSIKEIAENVGYYNDVAIIRAFKRYEGVTPGKYREMELLNMNDFDN